MFYISEGLEGWGQPPHPPGRLEDEGEEGAGGAGAAQQEAAAQSLASCRLQAPYQLLKPKAGRRLLAAPLETPAWLSQH